MRYLLARGLNQPWNNSRVPFRYTCRRYSTSPNPSVASDTFKAPRRRIKRSLSTLDPTKLTPDDWVDFRGIQAPSIRWEGTRESVPLHPGTGSSRLVAWPPSARGFLYFHRPPSSCSANKVHPAAGSLRFRCAESPGDLSRAFGREGKDVLVGEERWDLPWSIPLLSLRQIPWYAPVWQRLYSDGFVTSETSAEISRLLKNGSQEEEEEGDNTKRDDDSGSNVKCQYRRTRFGKATRVLEDVTQPWTFDLDVHAFSFVILAEDKIYSVRLRDVTMTERGRINAGGKQGVALVRFELDHEKRLVLRLLRYIVPPDFDIAAANFDQVEGQLVRQFLRYKHPRAGWSRPRPWSVDPASVLSPASYAALTRMYT
ncbi:hypothetical protein BKA70DRAFT_1314955 [Coprinopsis sp. MPI-PUGE-AT-0042]|nr:hypothetical protein BKA70DRAFT_1314955 [Coprinopsis sp. MPI-PUGE-AT-0042]